MSQRRQQDAGSLLRNAVFAAALLLTAAAGLVACSGFAASNETVPAPVPDADYKEQIASYMRSTFKDYASYDSYEISDPRWVHSMTGWSWLACVRFQDHSRRHSYALFLQSGKIVDSRYAVETDGCDMQAYAPFDLMTRGSLQPLH